MKIKNDVLGVLSDLGIDDQGYIRIGQALDRTLYTKVDKVLKACGYGWNRKEKAHTFAGDPAACRDKLDQVILTGEVSTARDIGFFPTPPKLAKELVSWAGVQPGDLVLEPSAGTGNIVRAVQAAGGQCYFAERDEAMYGNLAREFPNRGFFIGPRDFLSHGPKDYTAVIAVNRVVMNPPFIDYIDHVYKAFEYLRVEGVLVSVLPAGITFRQDRKHADFRKWLEDHDAQIEPLPPNSFKESGTSVNTVRVRIPRVQSWL